MKRLNASKNAPVRLFRGRGIWSRSAFALGLCLAAASSADVSITVGSAAATVIDGATTTINFPVTRGGDNGSAAVTVGYTTIDGSAVGGTDYTPAIGNLTIPAGSTTASVPVTVTGASGIQPDKQFSLQLMGVGSTGPVPSFGPPTNFNLANYPFSGGGPFVVADFNGDGKPDVAVAESFGSNGASGVSVFSNTTTTVGALGFSTPLQIAVSATPDSITTADFNGDGKPDLAVVIGASVSILLNTTATGATTPSFSSAFSFPVPAGIAADFNGDGRPDLLATSNDGVRFLLNTTAPNATVPTFELVDYPLSNSVAALPSQVISGDFNGDGKPDIALLDTTPGRDTQYFLEVRLNSTPVGAAAPTFSAPWDVAIALPDTLAMSVGDFNSDGKPDLLLGGPPAAIWINTTASGSAGPSFSGPTDINGTFVTSPVSAGDLNGDGQSDVVATADIPGSNNDNLVILTNITAPGAVGFAAPINIPMIGRPRGAPLTINSADFDGDGKADIGITDEGNTAFSVLLNTTQAGPAMQPGAPNAIAAGTIHYQSDVPQAFSFNPVSDAAPGTLYTSNAVTLSGTNIPSTISISGGQYSVNGAAYTAAAGTVQPGSVITVQLLSSSAYFTTSQAILTVGGVNGAFAITTMAAGSGSGGSSSSGGGSTSGTSSSGGASSSSGGSTSSSGGGSTSSSSSGGESGGSDGGGGGAINPAFLLMLSLAYLLRRGRHHHRL